jgi:transcriptional regulator with XRE-family HTH domain
MPLTELLARIGQNLHQVRIRRNEKILTVALSIHISQSVISQIEHGTYTCLSLTVLEKFADYYKISIDEIMQPQIPV